MSTAAAIPADDVAPPRPSLARRLVSDPGAALALAVVVLVLAAAVFAPWLAPFDPYDNDLRNTMAEPDAAHWLGTDGQGRDMLSRILFGLRITLAMGLLSVIAGGAVGIALGFVAAYYRRLDQPIMRTMDVLLSFPAILVGLALAAVFGPGMEPVVIAMAVATVPLMARIVRGAALVVLGQDFIEACRAVGMTDARLIWLHLAPNCLSPIFVFATLRLGQVILLGSALSFLGLGAQPPSAELGAMASAGRNFLFLAPHVAVVPSVAIFVVVLAFNVLGDALRDALDPRLRV